MMWQTAPELTLALGVVVFAGIGALALRALRPLFVGLTLFGSVIALAAAADWVLDWYWLEADAEVMFELSQRLPHCPATAEHVRADLIGGFITAGYAAHYQRECSHEAVTRAVSDIPSVNIEGTVDAS